MYSTHESFTLKTSISCKIYVAFFWYTLSDTYLLQAIVEKSQFDETNKQTKTPFIFSCYEYYKYRKDTFYD